MIVDEPDAPEEIPAAWTVPWSYDRFDVRDVRSMCETNSIRAEFLLCKYGSVEDAVDAWELQGRKCFDDYESWMPE